jgi:phospholipid transport system substrate-binding protein
VLDETTQTEEKLSMWTKSRLTDTIARQAVGLRRRSFLNLALAVSASPLLASRAFADAGVSSAVGAIQRFNEALIGAMKAGKQTDFRARYALLAPAIDEAFDLPAVLMMSIGSRWASIAPDEQSRLLDVFRRYTIANYVANFTSYQGQIFSVASDIRNVGSGQVVVQTRMVSVDGETIQLGYVMKETPTDWKIVDVLADGSISRVAVQRSDFRGVLAAGGGGALAASLQRKTSELSNGAIA